MKTNTIANTFGGLVAAAALASSTSAGAQEATPEKIHAHSVELPKGRIEAFSADQLGTLDTKVFGTLGKHVNYFGRNITTFNYADKTVSPFSFIDLSLNLGKGFTLVNETQFIDAPDGLLVTPRLGFEYFGTLTPISTNLTLYTINTVNIPTHRDPLINGENVTTLTYAPPIGKSGKYSGLAQVEAVTNYGENGFNFATQNFRLGICTKRYEAGLGLNLKHAPDTKMEHVVGPFFAVKF